MNSFGSKSILKTDGGDCIYFKLDTLEKKGIAKNLSSLPFSIRILLENLLRTEDGKNVTASDIEALAKWNSKEKSEKEISFTPARVLLQDFTGVPVVVDLAAMRDAIGKLGGNPQKINPLEPIDLVIDHSVQVDHYGSENAYRENVALEFQRNRERYQFLRWGQRAFQNFRVVPPGTGIVHQVNLEYLAPVVFTKKKGNEQLVYPDSLVGTDSHTTMINGLGVLGWGVGGIEAEAAMLGQPVSMLIPEVVGVKLTGTVPRAVTATDVVLTVTQLLRKKGVVGKFVEFYGPGLDSLTLADRATLANMAPEYGATMGFFPVDAATMGYLRLTGRHEKQVQLVETYLKAQGLFRTPQTPDPVFSDILELDLSTIELSIAGPKRPQDRVSLKKVKANFRESLAGMLKEKIVDVKPENLNEWLAAKPVSSKSKEELASPATIGVLGKLSEVVIENEKTKIGHGSVVIAAITSCTNTSNPYVLMAAGLLAKKAVELGLQTKPWVKPSLSPGSQVVVDYLTEAGLLTFLDQLKFHVTGYGCMTCIGNSGPLPEPVGKAVKDEDLVVAAVLSGNRNFEGRVNPLVKANYLASPPLVVAYALAGTMDIDFDKEPIGYDLKKNPVYLRDIWPPDQDVHQALKKLDGEMFRKRYGNVFEGGELWKGVTAPSGSTFDWQLDSTYIKHPPYFEDLSLVPPPVKDIHGARVLVMVGDSVTTDHISPAGNISAASPAGKYLLERGVTQKDFNSYGARRGNHEIMMRGTFANIRLKNLVAPGTEGGVTRHFPSNEPMSIFDVAMKYQAEKVPSIVIAGKEYGSGSSRDWAAKGPALLGVKAVIAISYERIHRSNLIGMGVLPLEFVNGATRESLGLTGDEVFFIEGIAHNLDVRKILEVTAKSPAGSKKFNVLTRIDTPVELAYYQHGGILQYVLRQLI